MIAEIPGWESGKIDYVLAFSQTPIDSDVYPHLPENWFDMLKTGVEDKGLFFSPIISNGIRYNDDADISRAWCRENADQVR